MRPATDDARDRRANRELRLLVLALGAVLTGYALVGMATDGTVPANLVALGAAAAALALVAHVARRRLAPFADPLLLPLALLLNGLGLVVVLRLDAALDTTLAASQTLWTVVAVAAFVATLAVIRDHRDLDRYRYSIGLAAIVLLLLPLLPVVGREINGARLWLRVAGLSFQPGEIAKLGLVIFFASYLAEQRSLLATATSRLGPLAVPPMRAFGPVVLVWSLSLVVLVFERDLGLSLVIVAIFVAMLYIATGRVAYVVGGGLLFGVGALVAWQAFAHVRLRISIWLDPFADAQGDGFQLVQSLFALGTGGTLGVGVGQGRPDLIPEVESDFVFAAIGEELGLVGATALLLCYALLVSRGFSIALRARDDYTQLLAAGLVTVLGLQVFVILGGVTRVIPLTGLTLPFISAGGSSLVANYVLVALLLRCSAPVQLPRPADRHREPSPDDERAAA